MPLTEAEFEFVRSLVLKRAAIVLDPEKRYLVETRLLTLARREGIASVNELVANLRSQPPNGLHHRLVDAMTTNETSFFRDIHPFDALRQQILPELIKRRAQERRLNIWCAASSSGQEPYSLAMLIQEFFPQLAAWELKIVASDISQDMLERARRGCYSQMEVNRGLSAALLLKYFVRQGREWQIKPEIRRMVDYRLINLIESWPPLPPMDIIMIRNVLIYFDVPTKRSILGRMKRVLQADGYLFLGGAETTINLDDGFERANFDRASCYRLRKAS